MNDESTTAVSNMTQEEPHAKPKANMNGRLYRHILLLADLSGAGLNLLEGRSDQRSENPSVGASSCFHADALHNPFPINSNSVSNPTRSLLSGVFIALNHFSGLSPLEIIRVEEGVTHDDEICERRDQEM